MKREKERERKKDSQTQQNGRERERERRESRESEQRPNPRRSGEIAPQPQTQGRDHAVEFAPPISLFLNLPLPFEPGLIVADLLDHRSLSRRFAFSPITILPICSLTDLLDLFDL